MDTIDRVNKYLEDNDLSIRYFTKTLSEYIDHDITEESFYQRHYSLLKRELKSIKPSEEDAYRAWLTVEESPHGPGAASYRLVTSSPDKKVDQMRKWLSSGIFNPTKARRLTSELKDMIGPIEECFSKINMGADV